MKITNASYAAPTLQHLLDNLDEILPGSESIGYYAGYCDDGYHEARDHVESYLSARLIEGAGR